MARLKKRHRQLLKPPDQAKWPPTFKLGWFKAGKIQLEEAAINDVVLRVPLKNLKLKPKKSLKASPTGDSPKSNNLKTKKERRSLSNGLKKIIGSKTTAGVKRGRSPVTNNVKRGGRPLVKRLRKTVNNSRTASVRKERLRKPSKEPSEKSITGSKWSALKTAKPKVYKNGQLPSVTDKKRDFSGKITIDFTKFHKCMDNLKLPSPLWKLQVIMNYDMTTVYVYSNPEDPKSVTFSQLNPYYKILIDEKPVVLLGCPKTVDSLKDLEILLDVVNRVDLRDCMVEKV